MNIAKKVWLLFAQVLTVILGFIFLSYLIWIGAALPDPDPSLQSISANTSYRSAIKRSIPSVVSIATSRVSANQKGNSENSDNSFEDSLNNSINEGDSITSLGSGVIVDKQGFVLTNWHVIESAEEIIVSTSQGMSFEAQVVGSDPETDLAVLKINSRTLPAIHFGGINSVQVGDVVLAIGNPFGIGLTVTQGIVSALGRTQMGINTFENFIQTDASINPGNSGGALIDIQGNLIGINTAIYSRNGSSLGIGFAIPISIAHNVFQQIIQKGKVERGWIGVVTQNLNDDLRQKLHLSQEINGALISGIVKNGPADTAGLKSGDIITKINGQTIYSHEQVLQLIATFSQNQRVNLQIYRSQQIEYLSLRIGIRPQSQKSKLEFE